MSEDKTGVQIGIARIYVKDISFESPESPHVFNQNANPEIQLNVGVKHQQVGEQMHEVVLKLNIEAKHEDKVIFIVELEQAGMFVVKGPAGDDLNQVLEIFCPTTLFPYARQTIDQLLSQGSLPPLMLSPINFEQLHRQRKD